MHWHTKEAIEQEIALRMFRLQQLPSIQNASNRLQEILGIEPGARFMGKQTVQVWEMPQKPVSMMQMLQEVSDGKSTGQDVQDTTTEDQKAPKQQLGSSAVPFITIQGAHEVEEELRTRHTQDKEPARRRDSHTPTESQPPQDNGLPPRTILQASPMAETLPQSQDGWRRNAAPKPPEIAGSTVKPLPVTSPTASPEPLFAEISPTATSASPPFRFAKLLSPKQQESLPIYWDWLLSKRVCEWLDDETTTSTQSELTRVELRCAEGTVRPLSYQMMNVEKIKLTRMTLSAGAETERSRNPAIRGPPEQRDWFIFEVQYKNALLAGMEMDEDGLPIGELEGDPEDYPEDYWLLALPVCAVTDSRITRPDQDAETEGQTTTWTVGREGLVPSMHGRGVAERFADGFINACAAGKGVIEFTSIG